MSASALGQRLTALLAEQHMSQRELAMKIGVTEVSVSRYVSGDRTPKGTVVANMAKALHTTPNYLLGETEQDFETDYMQILRLIDKDASLMTADQKATIARILFSAPSAKPQT